MRPPGGPWGSKQVSTVAVMWPRDRSRTQLAADRRYQDASRKIDEAKGAADNARGDAKDALKKHD